MTPEQAEQCANGLTDAALKVGQVWAVLLGSPNVSPELGRRAFDLLCATNDLKQDLWDLYPDVVDQSSLPRLEIDVLPIVDAMRRHGTPIREDAIAQLVAFAPKDVAYLAEHADSQSSRMDLLEQWARTASPAAVAMNHLARELGAERRWRRVVAARTLALLGIGGLLDPSTGDIDHEAAARWRSSR